MSHGLRLTGCLLLVVPHAPASAQFVPLGIADGDDASHAPRTLQPQVATQHRLSSSLDRTSESFAAADGAVILYVDDDAGPDGDGLSWETAFRFLQDALINAAPATEIRIAQGIYWPDRDEAGDVVAGDPQETFMVPAGTTLRGGYAGVTEADPNARDLSLYDSILSGDLNGDDEAGFVNYDDNSLHIVTLRDVDVEVVIDGFTITGGNAACDDPEESCTGGGIAVENGILTVVDTTITRNRALAADLACCWSYAQGAGLSVRGETSECVVSRCSFIGNHADGGAGGLLLLDGSLLLESSEFVMNTCIGSHEDNPCLVAGGAAVAVFFGAASIRDSTFIDNSSVFFAGALSLWAGDTPISLHDCEFVGNTSPVGGAIAIGFGPVEVVGCSFRDNASRGPLPGEFLCTPDPFGVQEEDGIGGAIFCQDDARIESCLFLNNDAVFGAAIELFSTVDVIVERCHFLGNTAEGGSAVGCVDSDALVADCLFAGNHAAQEGGASYHEECEPTFSNCTFASNRAEGVGGRHPEHTASAVTIDNCVLWHNSDADGEMEESQIRSDGTEPTISYSCIQGWTGTLGGEGNNGDDPLFADADGADDDPDALEDNDYRLASTSPCIDAGDNSRVPLDELDLDGDTIVDEPLPIDLDGSPRFVDQLATSDTGVGLGPLVDMGSFEYHTDCNDNGIPDETDIVVGTSQDLNSNELPDECEQVLGDLNFDGFVDAVDLLLMFASWGVCPPPPGLCFGDITGDGFVDAADLLILLGAWQP